MIICRFSDGSNIGFIGMKERVESKCTPKLDAVGE